MNGIFREYLHKFVLVFFDDILVYSKNLEDHVKHLFTVLQALRDHHFYANRKKCRFGQPSISYSGHVISQGVAADFSKVAAILSWPSPRSLRELRGFLGLTSYYRRFVKGYGEIAWPLTQQLKKRCFWLE